MLEINSLEALNDVLKNEKVVVDFHASYCAPCKMLYPVLDESEKKHPEIKYLKSEAGTANTEILTQKYDITSVPTLVFFKNGKEVSRHAGVLSKAKLEEIINAL